MRLDFAFQSIRSRSHRSGFSLVEVVFVAAILGIISAIALPRYAGFVASQQTQAAARRVVSDLMLAQRLARTTSTSQRVIFYVGTGTYQLPDLYSADRKSQAYSVDLSAEPVHATIAAAGFGGDSTVVFDGFGNPDTPGTLTIAVGQYRQTVTVDGGLTPARMDPRPRVEAIE